MSSGPGEWGGLRLAPSLEVVLIDAKRRELAGGRSYEGTREPYVQGVLIRMALAPPLFHSLFGLLLFFWVVLQVRKGSLAA